VLFLANVYRVLRTQILGNNQRDALFFYVFMYLFILCLDMLRASQRSSSGDRILLIHHLVRPAHQAVTYMKLHFHVRVLSSYRAVNTPLLSYEDHHLNALKVNVAAYGKDCVKQIGALWGKFNVVVGVRADGLYRYAPHNDVSVNDGPHIRHWSYKIIILFRKKLRAD